MVLSIVVSGPTWGSHEALEAAFEAANELRERYSVTVLVEVENSDITGPAQYWEGAMIRVGDRIIYADGRTGESSLIDEIVAATLEAIGTYANRVEVPSLGRRSGRPDEYLVVA